MSISTEQLPENQTIAAIDIGSNSFHLSVVRIVDGTLQPLVKDKRMVRLAEGLDASDNLSDEAMLRGLEVLKSFSETIQKLHSSSIRAVATHTLRRAKNRNEFLRLARKCMPVSIEVISGDEEARLIYQGVAHTTHLEGRRLVIDIGGGSTEFAIGEQFDILQLSSLPLGCVTYSKRYFPEGIISKKAFKAAELAASQRLEIIGRRFKNTGWESVIGCSGTAKAVAQFWQAHNGEFEGSITSKILKTARKELIDAGSVEQLKGVEEHRKSVFPAGLAILSAIFKHFDIEIMSISDAALREGVFYELTDRMQHEDIRERTINSLAIRYDIDSKQSDRVKQTAEVLLEGLSAKTKTANWKIVEPILFWAIRLHEIGLHINRRSIQNHSAYIIGNAELPGFSKEEQELMSLLLTHYRKGFNRDQFVDFTLYDTGTIVLLVAILRLSVLLNIRRLDDVIPNLNSHISAYKIKLDFADTWLLENPVIHEDLQQEAKVLHANGIGLTLS